MKGVHVTPFNLYIVKIIMKYMERYNQFSSIFYMVNDEIND